MSDTSSDSKWELASPFTHSLRTYQMDFNFITGVILIAIMVAGVLVLGQLALDKMFRK